MSLSPAFGWIKRSQIPDDTTEYTDEQCKRDLQEQFRPEKKEFNQLKKLAHALAVKKVILLLESRLGHQGFYIRYGTDLDEGDKTDQEFGLTAKQWKAIRRTSGPVILVDIYASFEVGACRLLAHEIGHHIEQLARVPYQEQSSPITKTMRQYFRGPGDEYFSQNRSEMNAEAMAAYLTEPKIKVCVRRHCDKILKRLDVENPRAARIVRNYRLL